MAIDELLRMIPPPASPVDNGSRERLAEVTSQLGLQLPDDLIQLGEHYGSGRFWDIGRLPIEIFNPFGSAYLKEVTLLCDILDEYKSGEIEVPYDIHPETPGLLPLGVDDQRGTLLWLTSGDANSWPLVFDPGNGNYQEFKMSLGDFLAKLFRRQVECEVWGAPPFFDDPTKIVFVPRGAPEPFQRD
jgi:hypothetical protein